MIGASVFKHIKDKKLIGSSQHGFAKGRSCLTNVIASSEMASSEYEEIAMHFIYSDFKKILDAVSHAILLDKLMQFGLHK